MKLNENGKLARFYRWVYGYRLPNNLCPFFWKMLFAVPLTIILWPSILWNVHDLEDRIITSIMSYLGLAAVGGIGFGFYSVPWAMLQATGILIGIIVAVALVVGALFFLTRSEMTDEITEVIRERKRSFKDKYCPKIEWTDL